MASPIAALFANLVAAIEADVAAGRLTKAQRNWIMEAAIIELENATTSERGSLAVINETIEAIDEQRSKV